MIPSLEEVLGSTRVVQIATRTRFRGIRVREAVLLNGTQRWSEFSPFLEYGDDEAAVWLQAALEYGWGDLPTPRATHIPVNATVPAVTPEEVPGVLARFDGCTTVKVKVAEPGQTIHDDVARVRAVREVMGPRALVRVDANGGWGPAEAVTAIRRLTEFNLDYVEQPTMGLTDLAWVREQLDGVVRIAADESVRKASDPLEVARIGAADLIVVKAQPLGGVRRALDIIDEAALPVVVSSALDTSVGIAMGVTLAAALPDGILAGACGLGTVELLAGDVTRESLVPRAGVIAVRDVMADEELLERFRAPADREVWWRDRITRAYALLSFD